MNVDFDAIRAGFKSLGDDAQVEAAVKSLRYWLENLPEYNPGIQDLIQRKRWDLLFDSFYQLLPFGTGGRRGAVGIGPNRINPVTVRDAVQGHCQFLKQRFPGKELRVVLAADVRGYHDMNSRYGEGLLGPLAGLTSVDFSKMAAEVYAANGIDVYMADPASGAYVSTPELSFQILYYQAHGGLNMSASHNPPDDNGAKFYNHEGGQEVPPHDEELVRVASQVSRVQVVDFEAAVGDRIHWLSEEAHQAYVDLNVSLVTPGERGARVVFSPLHGTGIDSVWPALEKAGFEPVLAEAQAATDGRFPTVPYRIPNPEVPSAMALVMDLGSSLGADLALATDPDADRLGAAAPRGDGTWGTFTGNQIGVLMLDHLIERHRALGTLDAGKIVIKTEVTTALISRLAEAAGIRCISHLLVGFKYIGDVIANFRNHGEWQGVTGCDQDFIAAMEESHGVLATPLIRDKDAAGGALLLAEMASLARKEGKTLWDRLYDIYRRHGYYGTGLRSVTMEGSTGLARIRSIQERLRTNPPREIAGRKVLAFHDRQDPQGVFGPIKSATDLASRDVLVFELEGNLRLILRPSGTEPKNKTYLEMGTPPLGMEATDQDLAQAMAGVDRQLKEILDDWEVYMMNLAGLDYPKYALSFSSLIPLQAKLTFIQEVAGEVVEKLAESGSEAWIRSRLEALAPLSLLLPGLDAWAATLPGELSGRWAEVRKGLS